MLETDTFKELNSKKPKNCDAALVLDDGAVFWGRGAGARNLSLEKTTGEICFNTSLTGYQEILTDPSYAGQIVAFTCPHIGIVGTNDEDKENAAPSNKGCVLGQEITKPSNWRANQDLNTWLKTHNITAITGVDTRRLTRRIRENGFANGAITYPVKNFTDLKNAFYVAKACPKLEGLDLADQVTCKEEYYWDELVWSNIQGYKHSYKSDYNVVAIDFGAKHNILRCLTSAGCKVLVVPAKTSPEEILKKKPDGIFLSNGPGDPRATGVYSVSTIQTLIESGIPIFGVCLGHQLLALALGASTKKMHHGHHGANHPVKELETGKIEITSQNHGFVVEKESLPASLTETHVSLFDGTLEGLRVKDKPIFSVQYHPEASPGPHDSHYLFDRFVELMAIK